RTPLGDTRVIAKIKHPAWYPPESIRKEHAANGDPLPKVVGAGPDNPLGDFALRLAAGNGEYMIHGTNNPTAVGMAVTHGCIRMYPEDVAAVFALVPVGTPVRLINEPVKVAWVDGQLLLEAHPPVDEEGQSIEPDVQLLSQMLDQALGSNTAAINWDLARATLVAASGMPTLVGLAAEPDTPPAPASQAAAGSQTRQTAHGSLPTPRRSSRNCWSDPSRTPGCLRSVRAPSAAHTPASARKARVPPRRPRVRCVSQSATTSAVTAKATASSAQATAAMSHTSTRTSESRWISSSTAARSRRVLSASKAARSKPPSVEAGAPISAGPS